MDSGRELPVTESLARLVRLRRAAALAALSIAIIASTVKAAETLVTHDDVARVVRLENLSVQGDRVAGVIVNDSDRTIRGVALQIVYSWLWADEHRQGTDDPSFVATEVVHDDILPRGNLTFGYSYPSALTSRADGRFLVDVRIMGFNSVTETRQAY